MKDCISKVFDLRLNWMFDFFFLILVNELTASVKSTKLPAKSCYLYPINGDDPSPWFSIQSNHDTTVVLEHIPITAPVNITLKNYQSEDTFCLLSVRLHQIDIYGSCILGDNQNFTLDNNNDDKTLVLHVHETIFQISVEDVVVKLNPVTTEMSEWRDKEDLTKSRVEPLDFYDDDQYILQISSNIPEENRLHAAVGCEYDTDDECIMEFEKTIVCIKNETTLMALSNSTELEGEVLVHYGNSEFKRTKPLKISLDEVDTWVEVAYIVPQFMEHEGYDGYILFLENKNLIYSPRQPGLVGTVREKELILDFTKTSNVKWGVPCPEKPVSLNKNFTVGTTTLENDAEIFIPEGSNDEIDPDMLRDMVRGELDQINTIIDSSSQPEQDGRELEPEPDFDPDPDNETHLDEPFSQPLEEAGDNDGSERANVESNAMPNAPEVITLMCAHLIVILTRSILFPILY